MVILKHLSNLLSKISRNLCFRDVRAIDITVFFLYALRAYRKKTVRKPFNNSTPDLKLEAFLSILRDRVSEATQEKPTVRCWGRNLLRDEIASILNDTPSLKSLRPARKMIESLQRIGWIKSIPVESQGAATEFFLVDMEAGKKEIVDSLELLQALRPSGVICYFSAINYYDLTTQIPPHHHIAWFPSKPGNPGGVANKAAQTKEPAERNPLGVEKFRFQGVPYFLTKRDPSLMAGVQLREVSSRTRLRITTLEQTLLDTLLQPVRSGGEAVIFETWENAMEQFDPDRMAQHLSAIERTYLDRRAAAMLEMLGIRLESTALKARFSRVQERLKSEQEALVPLPLLPGFDFPNCNKGWNIQVP